MRRAQASLLIESILLIIMLVLLGIFWGTFSRTTFLAGILRVEDTRLKHYCSSFLPILLANEYIRSGTSEVTPAVIELNKFLNITEPRLYPSAVYLKEKIRLLYGLKGINLADRSSLRVFNGTSLTQAESTTSFDLLSILGITASRGQLAACSFPLYGPEYAGYVNMTVII